MSQLELKELKVQLEEMLENNLIRPSVFSWGTPILLMKNKMVEWDYA